MALVQPPILLDRNPDLAAALQGQPQGADRAGEDRGEGLVELELRRAQQLAGAPGLPFALGRQVHVHPAGEAVLEVPLALAVAEQDKVRHGACG